MLNKLNKLKKACLEAGDSDTSDQVVFYQSAIYAYEVREDKKFLLNTY